MNITCFVSDAYGSFGGISRFNRDFLEALDRCPQVTRTIVFPRIIPNIRQDEEIPKSVVFIRSAANGKSAFILSIMSHFIRAPVPDAVVCGHINLLPIAYLYAWILRRKLVLIVHGIDAWTPNPRRLANRLVRHVDIVVSVSRFTAKRLMSWSCLSEDKFFILPNCVDLERFVPLPPDKSIRRRFGWTERHRVIMTMGRLADAERYKGFDEVLDVLPHLMRQEPNIRYLIVGDGNDRARLTRKVEVLGLADVVAFAGQIPDDERTAFYNAADLFVMPSRGEGFGIVLLEASACGLPIIGSVADGSAEALLHGKLGRLIDPSDQNALAKAILDRLSYDTPKMRLVDINYFSQKSFRERVEDLILRIKGEVRSADSQSHTQPLPHP